MTMLFTQTYRDSGFENLIPLGIAYMSCYGQRGRDGMIKYIREELEKQEIQFVFNCKFEFWFSGHPSNGDYGGYMIGDAYKLPKDFKDRCNGTVDTGNIATKQKVVHKKEYQFRCGLVTLETES